MDDERAAEGSLKARPRYEMPINANIDVRPVLNESLADIDRRLSTLERRVTAMEDGADTPTSRLTERLRGLDNRVLGLAHEVTSTDQKANRLGADLKELARSIEADFETEASARVLAIAETNRRIDASANELERVGNRLNVLEGAPGVKEPSDVWGRIAAIPQPPSPWERRLTLVLHLLKIETITEAEASLLLMV